MTTDDLEAFRAWLAAALPQEVVFRGEMPDMPDRCVAVMDYPGAPSPNWREDARVQIRLRGRPEGAGISPHEDAHRLADAVLTVVAPPGDDDVLVPLPGGRLAILRCLTKSPLPLGKDSKGRWEFTINVALDFSRV